MGVLRGSPRRLHGYDNQHHNRGSTAQLDIYKVLKSTNIEEQIVSSVIESMEAHIDGRIQVAQPILAKLDALQVGTAARFDALQSSLGSKIDAMAQVRSETEKAAELRSQRARWITGTAVAAVGVTLATLEALRYL